VALVLIVHDDATTRELVVASLITGGLLAVGFHEPVAASDAIETGSAFACWSSAWLFGVALARMLRLKRPGLN
jgi:hypothetical protein